MTSPRVTMHGLVYPSGPYPSLTFPSDPFLSYPPPFPPPAHYSPVPSLPSPSIPMEPARSLHYQGSGGGREDCWSQGATVILIEVWGDRYINLNRRNLRQKDWKEVADAVNARQNCVKPRKTDAQCKNRIDTLKKKFKLEKAKPPPSKWPFFYRLDSLIGVNSIVTPKKKPDVVNFTVKSKLNPKPELYPGASNSTEASFDGDDAAFDERVIKKQHRMEDVDFSDGIACRELSRAILKFAEIYERIESSKQQQMVELEKQRMEFTKELEFERINMYMDAQFELEKKSLKRGKHGSSGSGRMPSSGKFHGQNNFFFAWSSNARAYCISVG